MTDFALRVALIAAIGVVLLVPVAWRLAHKRLDPFEPLMLFLIAYGVMFVVRPAAMIAKDDLAYHGPRRAINVSATFTEMLLLALVGAVFFVVGYELPFGRRLAQRLRAFDELDERRLVVSASVVAAIGIASFLLFLASASGISTLKLIFQGRSPELATAVTGASFYLWFSFFLLVPATLILFALSLHRRSKALFVGSMTLAALILLRTIPLGARITLLPLIGGLLVLIYLRRSRRPSALALLLIAGVAVVGSTFVSDLRGRETRGESVYQSLVRATRPSRLQTVLVSGPDSDMAPALAAALAVIPEQLHYTYGRTIFGDLLIRPIPRALWKGKPVPPRDKLLTRLWAVESRSDTPQSAFSTLLYFYWDFSVAGVAAGMLLLGIGARLLFAYFLRQPSSLAVQVLYALALWFVVIGLRDGPVDTFIRAMFVVFPAWVVFRIAAREPVHLAAPVTSK